MSFRAVASKPNPNSKPNFYRPLLSLFLHTHTHVDSGRTGPKGKKPEETKSENSRNIQIFWRDRIEVEYCNGFRSQSGHQLNTYDR